MALRTRDVLRRPEYPYGDRCNKALICIAARVENLADRMPESIAMGRRFMKYSLRILFLLCIAIALVTNLAMRGIEWPIMAIAGLGVLLVGARCSNILRIRTRTISHRDRSESDIHSKAVFPVSNLSINAVVDWTILVGVSACFAFALFGMLSNAAPKTTEFRAINFRFGHSSTIAILATVVLALGIAPIRPSRPNHPSLYVLIIFLRIVLFVAYCFSLDIVLWLVYVACKGMEQGRSDPGRILGNTEVLSYSSAFLNASIGAFGLILWFFTARTVVLSVLQKSNAWFVKAWLLCGISCMATLLQWYLLLVDFPYLGASLAEMRKQPLQFNAILAGLLFVFAVVQYCFIDRTETESICSDDDSKAAQVWRNRLLGLAMIVPGFLFCALFLYSLRRFKNLDFWNSFYVWFELIAVDPVMLLALSILGFTLMVNASAPASRRISVTTLPLLQVIAMSIAILICVPFHLPAMMFYLDALLTLSPGW